MMKPTVSDFLSKLSPGLAQKVTGLFSVVPYPICGLHEQHVKNREKDGGWAEKAWIHPENKLQQKEKKKPFPSSY